VIKGQAGQVVGAEIVTAAGAAYGGAVTVYIDGDHSGQAIGTVGAGAANNRGNGYYDYIPSATETSYNHIAFTFVPAAAVPVTVAIDTITPAQLSALQSASGLSSVVVNELLLEAFIEIRMGRAGDGLEPELLTWALAKFNRMLDKWNADPSAAVHGGVHVVYADGQPISHTRSGRRRRIGCQPKGGRRRSRARIWCSTR
jgi:hypothetical protein